MLCSHGNGNGPMEQSNGLGGNLVDAVSSDQLVSIGKENTVETVGRGCLQNEREEPEDRETKKKNKHRKEKKKFFVFFSLPSLPTPSPVEPQIV